MSDADFQRAPAMAIKRNVELEPILTKALSDQPEAVVPSSREMALGLGLFSFSMALYSIYCMLIKIMLTSYQLTVPELTYYIAVFLVIMFYLFAAY